MNSKLPGAAAKLPAGTAIGRVRLRVAELGRALDFYRDVLGFRVVRDQGSLVGLAPAAANGTAPELVVLEEVPGIRPRPKRPLTAGLYHVALLVPGRADLGRALLGLHAADYPLRGMADHSVSESLYLDDPDGNGLEIYSDRPRSEWVMQNGIPQMTVDPMDVEGVVASASGSPDTWSGFPGGTTVGHLHFTVSDLEPSVAFYRDIVGFDEGMRMPGLAAVAAGGYHHHVNLNVWAGEGAPAEPDRIAGLTSFELRVPEEGLAALRSRLGTAGAHEDESGAIVVRDPDGVTMHLVDSA